MKPETNILYQKLHAFIKRYYLNRIIRGLIWTSFILIALYLILIFLEYQQYFSPKAKTFIILSVGLLTISVFFWMVFLPTLKYFRIGPTLTYEEAAKIAGQHFSNIRDKILNALQLEKLARQHPDNVLILAGIKQKTEEIKPVPIHLAINLKENVKYLKYPSIPFFIFLLIYWYSPSVVKESTYRFIHYDKVFTPPLPFQWKITNPSLTAKRNENFTLEIEFGGKELPQKVYIEQNGYQYKMDRTDYNHFTFTWKNLKEDIDFIVKTDQFLITRQSIKVIPNPRLENLSVEVKYPAYLSKSPETLQNINEITVPEGTQLHFRIKASDAEWISVTGPTTTDTIRQQQNFFTFEKKAKSSHQLKITPRYKNLYSDTFFFNLAVIPDAFPSVEVIERPDSANPWLRYFFCVAKDDYGLKRLEFHYRIKQKDKIIKQESFPVQNNIPGNYAELYHFFDFDRIQLPEGSITEYFFKVWDNDAVNGSKSSVSQIFILQIPQKDQIEQLADSKEEEIKSRMQNAMHKIDLFQNKLDKLKQKLSQQNQTVWQDKQDLRDLLQLQKDIQNQLKEIQQLQKEKNKWEEKFAETDPELIEKQKLLEELLKELMTPELQKLLEELQKLTESENIREWKEKLEETEKINEDLSKQMDRSLELFKQLKLEKDLQETIDALEELAKKQEELSEKTKENISDKSQLLKEQEQLNEQFKHLQQKMEDIRKLNSELEKPQPLPNTEMLEQNISEQQNQSMQQMQNNQNKKASGSQKNAAQKMQEMKQNLQFALEQMQQQQNAEDINHLRNILDNLIELSKTQENIMQAQVKTKPLDPAYINHMQNQFKIKDKFQTIEDSLMQLAKRNPQIKSVVFKETSSIRQNVEKATKMMEDRKNREASVYQQNAITALNNLALLLNESLQQMQQQQQQNNRQGSGSCNNPNGQGQGKPSIKSMKQLQQNLSKQLEEMKKALEQGGKMPQNKPDGVLPGESLSKKLAQMAAQQAQIREELQRMAQEMKNKGQSKALQQIADMMEQIEKDIVNKNITNETLRRQQDIMTRLLEAENAEREREYDEQRESKEPQNYKTTPPPDISKMFPKETIRQTEELKNIPPHLKPYYKNIVNNYYKNLNQN